MNAEAKAVARREPIEADDGGSLLAVIAKAASDPNVDINKMRALLEMRRELEIDQAKRLFSEAMNALQEKIKPIAADAANPQTSSKYASYFALDKVLRPIYTEHGFEVSFDTEESPKADHIRVLCAVAHKAGHSRLHKIDMPISTVGIKGTAMMTLTHATASGVTYGKRITLGMGFNIAVGTDDDGNAAGAGLISEKQRDELIALADEHGVDKEAFCKWAEVPSLADISARNFAKAKTAMQAKGKQKETA